MLAIAGGVIASGLLLWLVSGEPVLGVVFVGGFALLSGALTLLLRQRPAERTAEFAEPDWSVTQAAINHEDAATAIIDRAGRLACANTRFVAWFGIAAAPPRLPLEPPQRAALDAAARAAWRDGVAEVAALALPTGPCRLSISRAGRGEDYLVWRFIVDKMNGW